MQRQILTLYIFSNLKRFITIIVINPHPYRTLHDPYLYVHPQLNIIVVLMCLYVTTAYVSLYYAMYYSNYFSYEGPY